LQSIDQQMKGVLAGMGRDASFQVADPAGAQARPLRQFFLCQANGESMASE